ncbi:Thiamine pyrophosphate enzyme C-terminal TPP-binding [Penicillium manginii]|uniref:Thiamine pyrophosphate enzyme C-terminal TPP-binding n=1 Tax=Penicillium manginii TaxID=203109 RepID=UPI002546EEB7|nr:Thiamine pyrophosphate enzyme C-terminal TPP-binding [Penicillium manginii]KAJ5742059.1 Thiamine pyrophosphate enzyme C-terminal TPP-binding [Penicillium manginii]
MSKGRSYGAGICPHIQEARSCLTTSGPGAINLITPLQDALKDDIPLVVLTGEVPTYAIGTEALQEAEVIGITGPCMKWDIRDLAAQINDAFRIVMSGRPGPVLVVLPKYVTSAVLQVPARFITTQCLSKLDNIILRSDVLKANRSASIEICADLIKKAQKPALYADNGVLSCAEARK